MSKRFNIFLILILAVMLAAAATLFYLLQKQKVQSVVKGAEETAFHIEKVLDEAVVSPIGAFDNQSIWYFNSVGRMFRANPNGTNLSEYPLPSIPGNNLKRVLWPKTGSDFISISGNGSKDVKSFYDSIAKVFINLSDSVRYIDWLPDGKRVVYISQQGNKQQLVTANADNTGYKTISEVFWPDLVVKAGNSGKTALMYRSEFSGDTNKIYLSNLETGEISTLVDKGKTVAASWLPAGNRFLFAQSTTAADPKIYLYDLVNQQVVDLKLNTSLDKVVVDLTGRVLYAAVPKKNLSLPGGVEADSTGGDTFVKIDLTNYRTDSYFEPSSKVVVKNLMLMGNTVYFVDANDNKLYSIGK